MKKNLLKIITLAIPVLVVVLFLFRKYLIQLTYFLPPCKIYNQWKIYCPSCGNTRSTIALLNGDIISSLQYNIVPLLLIYFLFLGYIELVTYSFGRYIRILPRKPIFYIIGALLITIYFIVRNVFQL